MILKNISVKMINVLPIELNCIIRMINIKPNDIAKAVPRNVDASAWSSWPPPIRIETPSGALKVLIACDILATTSLGLKAGLITLETNEVTLRDCLCLMLT